MNKLILLSVFLFASPPLLGGDLEPAAILDKSLHLDAGKSALMQSKITVYEGGAKRREREMALRRKVVRGLDQVRIDFTAPADIKGMALLIRDQRDKDSDQYLYSPALRRVRRIRGSVKSESFADTDFSYEDMERRSVEDAQHTLEGEETVDGFLCFRILSKTKKGVRSQYDKTLSWIDKDSFILRKMEMYGRDNNKVKVMRTLKAELISGIWTLLKLEMTHLIKHRSTLYEVSDVKYDVPLDDQLFLTSSLGQ